jgi:aspartate racemase
MKTIGLIGGMSWESTAQYYALLNRLVKNRLGGYHSAKLLLYSIDFDELAKLAFAEDWQGVTEMMVDAARLVERAGADCVLIGANTPHIAAEAVEKSIGVPLLHIADAAGRCIVARGIKRVALLGTAFTMEREFYKSRLHEKFGLCVTVPEQRQLIHDIIVKELVYGLVNPESKAKLREVIAGLTAGGAEGIILGCTELPMIVDQTDSTVPLFDTTAIHSEAAVEWALA